jgi:SAM-dependent MidA family methyltransferase
MQLELPEPGWNARKHSWTLVEQIQASIKAAGGWISFADYMHQALYAPGLGYYSAGATKFGAEGDFVTAPELSPLFSQCLAQQCAQVLQEIGATTVLELGAGQGTMAAAMLLEFESLDALPDDYYILETSADLRERQQALISQQAGHLLERVTWLDRAPPEPIRGVIVANEVADALPVNRFVIDETQADRVSELGVTWQDDKFAYSVRPARGVLLKNLLPVLQQENLSLAHGYTSELSQRLPAWIASIADWLDQGVVLLFDYGFSRADYYHADRGEGTLRCYYRHRMHDDPFVWPGLQDITAWVDFTLLAESAAAAGLDVAGYTTQAQFLLASGITERLERMSDLAQQQRLVATRNVQRLILPGEMGETIKVMALSRGDVTVPEGMTGRDMRGSL